MGLETQKRAEGTALVGGQIGSDMTGKGSALVDGQTGPDRTERERVQGDGG